MERLDKFLASQLAQSRTGVREYLKQGRIKVNGAVQKKYDFKIDPSADSAELDGEAVVYRKFIYIMLNKPSGVLCSTEEGSTPTVMDLIPPGLYRKNMFPAGRLDKDTEGFVLITDDGVFCHKIISPKKDILKTYYAIIDSPITAENLDILMGATISLDGKPVRPAIFSISDAEKNEIKVQISEGRYHQVKRMFEAVGHQVVFLKRTAIGGLELDTTLEAGQCREISKNELTVVLS